jgi:hypothetical protein
VCPLENQNKKKKLTLKQIKNDVDLISIDTRLLCEKLLLISKRLKGIVNGVQYFFKFRIQTSKFAV